MADTILETGPKGSRALWLEAAHALLLESGVDAVRILPLGRKLGLSRTSFYWFFADRGALLAALLEQWRDTNTGGLVRQTAAYAETIAEAVLNLFDCWLDATLFDARFEVAVRGWGQHVPEVGAALAEADAARLAALTAMFVRFGFDATAADVRARTIYLTQIGYISMDTSESLTDRLQRIPHYVEIFTGTLARPAELARFRARHADAGTLPAVRAA
ncbi:TetR/AcrR family transcriptional regulator [Lichenihabitans sp. Uapishka_5]|uniref:TetR/AcrR family transcriptional regulator n=1 Tax=Lichenihabitans sp. Uapishka_5 TaxID=3037302 RepID=UPI0029E7E866|nr:TetR/AcrR family transcriptional regulator [Lichenihabitans sp. Uapishka_5]MDX7951223.1 TetR/AcrR family transcriptional regulator [Lichenihabitans sp. Uapishka_5]